MNTSLMNKLFSDTNEELKEKFSDAVDAALDSGKAKVKTDEDNLSLKKVDENKVEVTDNLNGESTMAEVDQDSNDVSLTPKQSKKYCNSRKYSEDPETTSTDSENEEKGEEVPKVTKSEGTDDDYVVTTKDASFGVKGFSNALFVARRFSDTRKVEVDLTNVDGSNIEPEKSIDKDLGVIDNGEKSGTSEHRTFSDALEAAEDYVKKTNDRALVEGENEDVILSKRNGKICYSVNGEEISRHEVVERNDGTVAEPSIKTDPEEGVTDPAKAGTKDETEMFADDINTTVDKIEDKVDLVEQTKNKNAAEDVKKEIEDTTEKVENDKSLSRVRKYSLIQRLRVFSQVADSVIEENNEPDPQKETEPLKDEDKKLLEDAQKSFSNTLSYNTPYKVFATSDQIKSFSQIASNPCLKSEF